MLIGEKTAVLCGITVAAGVDRFPAQWLTSTPFSGCLIPGVILAVVVGGSATVAPAATLRSRVSSALASIVAGAILLGWLAASA